MWSVARRATPAALALLAVGGLGGCARSDSFAPACPQPALLRDGADMARFAGNGRDITDLVLDAHLTAVSGSCKYVDRAQTKVEATLQVRMSLARGPAMRGRAIDVPYFVGVTEDGRVLDHQGYALRAEFPANTDRLSVAGEEITLVLPVAREKTAAAYKVWVSFQLTPDELARNRGGN